MSNPMHSSATPEHYTPIWIVDAVRRGLSTGPDDPGIDLDPASCALAQAGVGARHYFDLAERGEDGLALYWADYGSRVFCNPPGDSRGVLVKMFWKKAIRFMQDATGRVVVFIHFSLEQILSLSRLDVPGPSVAWPAVVLTRRVAYDTPGIAGRRITDIAVEQLEARGQPRTRQAVAAEYARLYTAAKTLGKLERVPGPSPTHGSFVSVVTDDVVVRDRVVAELRAAALEHQNADVVVLRSCDPDSAVAS